MLLVPSTQPKLSAETRSHRQPGGIHEHLVSQSCMWNYAHNNHLCALSCMKYSQIVIIPLLRGKGIFSRPQTSRESVHFFSSSSCDLMSAFLSASSGLYDLSLISTLGLHLPVTPLAEKYVTSFLLTLHALLQNLDDFFASQLPVAALKQKCPVRNSFVHVRRNSKLLEAQHYPDLAHPAL